MKMLKDAALEAVIGGKEASSSGGWLQELAKVIVRGWDSVKKGIAAIIIRALPRSEVVK